MSHLTPTRASVDNSNVKPANPPIQPPALGLTLSVLLVAVVLVDPAGAVPVLPGAAAIPSTRQDEARDSFAAQLVLQLHRWQGGQVAIAPVPRQSMATIEPTPVFYAAQAVDDALLPDSPLQVHLLNLPPPRA